MYLFLIFLLIGTVFGWYRYMRDKRRAASTDGILWVLSILGSIVFRIYVYRETGLRPGRLEIYFLIFMPLLLALLLGYFLGEFLKYLDIRINGEHYDVRGGRGIIMLKTLFGWFLPARQYGQNLDLETRSVAIISSQLYQKRAVNLKRLIHSICFVLRVKPDDKLVIRQIINLQSVSEKDIKTQITKLTAQAGFDGPKKREFFRYLVNIGVRCEIDLLEIRDQLRMVAELLGLDLPTAQSIIQEIVDQREAASEA